MKTKKLNDPQKKTIEALRDIGGWARERQIHHRGGFGSSARALVAMGFAEEQRTLPASGADDWNGLLEYRLIKQETEPSQLVMSEPAAIIELVLWFWDKAAEAVEKDNSEEAELAFDAAHEFLTKYRQKLMTGERLVFSNETCGLINRGLAENARKFS